LAHTCRQLPEYEENSADCKFAHENLWDNDDDIVASFMANDPIRMNRRQPQDESPDGYIPPDANIYYDAHSREYFHVRTNKTMFGYRLPLPSPPSGKH
jgi:hypothetical protein